MKRTLRVSGDTVKTDRGTTTNAEPAELAELFSLGSLAEAPGASFGAASLPHPPHPPFSRGSIAAEENAT